MDELELLRGAGIDVPLVDDGSRSRARGRLESMIAADTGTRSQPPHPSRRRRRTLVAGSIAAIAAVFVIAQTLLPPGSGGPNAAQAALRRLSGIAANMTTPTLKEGQFLYVRSSGVVAKTQTNISLGITWSFTVEVDREVWSTPDGAGRLLERFDDPRFVSSQDRDAWLKAGRPPLLPHRGRRKVRFAAGELFSDLAALPEDPARLAVVVSSGGVKTSEGASSGAPLTTIADLLGEVPTSVELRSTLFQATAQLSGIVWLGTVGDPIGREGVGVAMVRSGVRTELIFDPQSSALLAVVIARVDASGAVTQMLESLSYATRGVVTSDHARPS